MLDYQLFAFELVNILSAFSARSARSARSPKTLKFQLIISIWEDSLTPRQQLELRLISEELCCVSDTYIRTGQHLGSAFNVHSARSARC